MLGIHTRIVTCPSRYVNVTGDTITAQIRTAPDTDATLVATFAVTVVDAPTGEILLVLDNSVTAGIDVGSGYMDIKRTSGGEPLPVFDRPLEVRFAGTVTE